MQTFFNYQLPKWVVNVKRSILCEKNTPIRFLMTSILISCIIEFWRSSFYYITRLHNLCPAYTNKFQQSVIYKFIELVLAKLVLMAVWVFSIALLMIFYKIRQKLFEGSVACLLLFHVLKQNQLATFGCKISPDPCAWLMHNRRCNSEHEFSNLYDAWD